MRIIVVAALALGSACVDGDTQPDRPPSEIRFEGSDAVLYVEVADTPADRRRGLMGVEELPHDEGMAFVFEGPVSATFWMKDTLIPLSIAFVGRDGRIVGLREMQPCEAEPCPRYGTDRPYVVAIEANAGWFEDHGVREGDRAELEVMPYR
jgi:uncharacterized membrane protein (UPF0127 family)